jgi:hypothetical protein
MFSYSTGYYVSPPDDQYLKFKNRCSLLSILNPPWAIGYCVPGGWGVGGGEFWILKLRQKGTHRVHLRGLPSLAGRVGLEQDNIFFFACLVDQLQENIFRTDRNYPPPPSYTGSMAARMPVINVCAVPISIGVEWYTIPLLTLILYYCTNLILLQC